MLRWRLLLGAAFIAALVGLLWLDARAATPGVYLLPLAIVLAILASEELLGLFRARGLGTSSAVVYLGNTAIVLANFAALWFPQMPSSLTCSTIAFGIALAAVFLAEMARYTGPGHSVERLGLAVLALAYVGLLLSFVAQLRLLGPGSLRGIAALASLVIAVKMCDIGAYAVGRLVGRHKLVPVLSPGKTIEGSIGGLVFAVASIWLFDRLLMPRLLGGPSAAPWGWLAFGLVVGAAGMIGDLAESLIKRDVGRKDSSAWMPGFGGVLDILDSVLLAAPVAYLFWICGWFGR